MARALESLEIVSRRRSRTRAFGGEGSRGWPLKTNANKIVTIGPRASAERGVELDLGGRGGRGGSNL